MDVVRQRSDAGPVCYSKPLDSVKNWNDHFSGLIPPPFPFLYPTFWDGEEEMDLFAFIRHSDPTKVRAGERNLAEREVKLLKMTKGRTVSLNPPVTAASGDSSDSVDKMFDKGSDADQEHLAEKDDDVLEEVVALDASKVVADKAKEETKEEKGSAIPSDATGPFVTASVTPISDVGPVDSVSGLNLRTRPPHVRYVVSSDSSHHSASYSKAVFLVRSPAADVPVVTVAVTTTVDANITAGVKAKDAAKDFKHIGDSAFAGGVDADAASISKSKKPSISLDSFYASQSLDTKTMHHVYVLRWKVTNDSVLEDPYVCRDMMDRLAPPALFTQLRAMDYDQLYSEFNIRAARQVCLGAEVRMRAEHTLERKEAEAAEAISLCRQLSEVEAADAAKSTDLRDLKEKNFALEGERNVLSERVETFESVATSNEIKLASLSSQVATLTADLSGFQLSRDELNSNSLKSAFEFLKEQAEKMQDEQVGVLSERVAAIYSDLMDMVLHMDAEFYPRYLTTIAERRKAHWSLPLGFLKNRLRRCRMSNRVAAIYSDLMDMVLHMDAEFYPRYLTTIAERRWILSRRLKLVLAKCLSLLEYLFAMGEAIGRAIDKGMQDGLTAGIEHGRAERSITDVAAFNPSVESDYVAAVNALEGVSFLLLAQLEANKEAIMVDVMDLLRLEGPAAETSKASQLQPSLDQLMILIHRLEDQVIIGETYLAFSLEVAHNRVQRLRGDATACCLSLTDSSLSLVKPLSARNLIGEPSSSADLTIAVTTAISTTFVQTDPVPTVLSSEVPPPLKIIFEEEELNTTPEHVPAP
ncbi:hypothetical protein Tco_0240615 [Tanacetum coccineum]